MKNLALSLLLILGPLSARAESRLYDFVADDSLASHRTLAEGDVLLFPNHFLLDKFSSDKGYAASVISGKDHRGRDYACVLSLAAISEVQFASDMSWEVSSIASDGEVTTVSLLNRQFNENRPLQLRCTQNASVGELLAGQGVKLLEVKTHEAIDERMPSSI